MLTPDEVRSRIRSFILSTFLPGEEPETLKDSTLLVTSGVITSVSMLELVDYIEEEFAVFLLPEDIGGGRMDTIDMLVDLVTTKQRSAPRARARSG
jgi:acyl carrier protein